MILCALALIVIIEVVLGVTAVVSPTWAFVLLFSMIIGVATIINPDIGLVILVLVLPFSAQFTLNLSGQYSISMVHCQLLFLVFVKLVYFAVSKDAKIHGTPFDFFLFVMCVWIVATFVWAPNLQLAFLHFFALMSAFLIAYMIINCAQTERSYNRFIWAWWVMASVMAFVGLLQFLGVQIGTFQSETRVAGFSGVGNEFARLMIVSVFLMMGMYRGFKLSNFMKLLLGISILFCLMSMLFSLSRTSLVAAFFAFFIYGMRNENKRTAIFKIFLPVSCFCIVVLIFMSFSADITQRIESMAQFTEEYSWQSRAVIWAICTAMFLGTYGLGVGAGGIEAQFDQYYYMLLTGQQQMNVPSNAHSVYLDVLVHFGIVGVLVCACIVIRLWRYLAVVQRKLGYSKYGEILWGISCGLIALAFQGAIASVFHTFTLWGFIGLAVVTAQIGERELEVRSLRP